MIIPFYELSLTLVFFSTFSSMRNELLHEQSDNRFCVSLAPSRSAYRILFQANYFPTNVNLEREKIIPSNLSKNPINQKNPGVLENS